MFRSYGNAYLQGTNLAEGMEGKRKRVGVGGLEADLSGSEAETSRHSLCIRQFPRPDALS